MSVTRDAVVAALAKITDPESGQSLISADVVRALSVENGVVRFVLEATDGEKMEAARIEAVAALEALEGVEKVLAVTTAAAAPASPKGPPPDLNIGGKPIQMNTNNPFAAAAQNLNLRDQEEQVAGEVHRRAPRIRAALAPSPGRPHRQSRRRPGDDRSRP